MTGSKPPRRTGDAAARDARQAAALRANLRRRKDQKRARAADPADDRAADEQGAARPDVETDPDV